MKRKFNCKWCKKEVIDWPCRRRFACSRSCQIKLANTGIKRSKIWKNLDWLVKEYQNGKTFAELGKKYKVNRFSLQIIFKKARIKARKTGARIGKIPWSKGKQLKYMSGEKNWNWKGGITPLIRMIRACRKYKSWMEECLKRDKRTCVKCKTQKGILDVDHYPMLFSKVIKKYKIISYKGAMKCLKLWDIRNGRTLCRKCHKTITSEQRKNSFK